MACGWPAGMAGLRASTIVLATGRPLRVPGAKPEEDPAGHARRLLALVTGVWPCRCPGA